VNTGNVEFAALFAPGPQGMTTANDWTKEMATKGFPELQQLYGLLGAPKNVLLHRGEHFPHNYNAVSRSAFFTWLNRHFRLGQTEPVIERDFVPLSRGQLTVWDAAHPAPKADDADFERRLLRWWKEDADAQQRALVAQPARFREVVGGGVEVLVGRTFARSGDVQWKPGRSEERDSHREVAGRVRNVTHGEELPVTWLQPKRAAGRVVIWLGDDGRRTLRNRDGTLRPEVRRLLDAGVAVVGADLLYQGEFPAGGPAPGQARMVANPREAPCYTYGYNHALPAQRAHDVLTLVRWARHELVQGGGRPGAVAVVGLGEAGLVVAAARAVAGDAIERAVVDTRGFRFAQLRDYRDPRFLPGGAKYLDVPGLLALGAPQALWLAGEGADAGLVREAYRAQRVEQRLHAFAGPADGAAAEFTAWLLQ
jgi:hypothetical protein